MSSCRSRRSAAYRSAICTGRGAEKEEGCPSRCCSSSKIVVVVFSIVNGSHLCLTDTFFKKILLLPYSIDEGAKSLAYCDNIASQLNSLQHLPQACHKYKSVVQKLESKAGGGSAEEGNSAFAGMSPGQVARSKAARLSGRETQAQFQRRMTRSHKMSR